MLLFVKKQKLSAKYMKKPANLKLNDKISTIAPSFGVTTEPYKTRYLASVKRMKKEGYLIEEGENVFKAEGVASSASPKERAQEFIKAYKSDSKVIISVGGGELMCDILPYIDFEEIKNLPPKWFMGFSDNTNLTFTLTTLCDIETIYGPNFPGFFEKQFRVNQLDSLKMLHGENHFEGYPKWKKTDFNKPVDPNKTISPLAKTAYRSIKKIIPYNYNSPFSGRIIGGCLDCLVNICGTKFDKVEDFAEKYKEDGFIWYLEACDLSPLSFRRALFQLKESNWFKYVKGFLIGRPFHFGDTCMGVDFFSATLDMLSEFNVPILMDIDLGHNPPSLPMKNGALATVKLENNNIIIDYKNSDE